VFMLKSHRSHATILGLQCGSEATWYSCSTLFVCCCSPEAYVAAKHAMKTAWPLKTDDFFPYADCPHCYWTGVAASKCKHVQGVKLCFCGSAICRSVLLVQSSLSGVGGSHSAGIVYG
jgi:hypothetical protein